MSGALREFGWEPIIVTVDPAQYEEENDPASLALLPQHLRIERVCAISTKFCRPLGLGDIALRGQFALRRRVAKIIRREHVDLVFCTVLPGYTSLVGAWAKRKFGLPFVLDYQDPWASGSGGQLPSFSKAGLAHWIATKLEPGVVSLADALTAVSDETLDGLRKRGLICAGIPVEILPIGADKNDHSVASSKGRSWIVKKPETFHLAYIGTLTERMLPALRALMLASQELTLTMPSATLRLHLIGTSAQPTGEDKIGIMQLAGETRVKELIELEPRRVPYLDALRTMQDADLLLLLGSTDSHYTASKLFPCWLAKRPILGVFHSASTVNELARELGGVDLVTYNDADGPETRVKEVASALQRIVAEGNAALPPRHESAFEPYSGRGIARTYAKLFDRVLAART
jgi:hypothetical protein